MKLVIYGVGSGYRRVVKDINNSKAEIVCLSDGKKYEDYVKIDKYRVVNPNELIKVQYDYIVIASQYYDEIRNDLLKLGIQDNKIISYFDRKREKYDFFIFDKKYNEYIKLLNNNHPFNNFKKIMLGDSKADPTEFFSHYDGYSFWLAKKINEMGNNKKILDLGNRKATNAILSINNQVDAIVLKDCNDKLSNINYVIQDINEKLKFEDNKYDVFSSLASIHLVGLGRYGDKKNPYCLLDFLEELDRVMKSKSDLILSTTYGKNALIFDNGWIFDMDTIKKLFSKWELVDYLIDNNSSPTIKEKERYTRNLDISNYNYGEYRTIFLHFRRGY